jgi:S1-C subfamily serine protease
MLMNEVLDAFGSAKNDLALLQLAPYENLIPRPLTLSTELYEEGDELAVCGWPFGLELHQDQQQGGVVTASFAPAMVSAVLPSPRAAQKYPQVFQLAATINGGNSGGPVFDPGTGEVLGVVISSIEVEQTFRAEVPVRDPTTKAILQWRTADVSISVPSGIARAASVYTLQEQIPKFIQRFEQRASATSQGPA